MNIGFTEESGDIMAFADVDSDKFTDIITVKNGHIELHLFDNQHKKFVHAKDIEVPGCSNIRNIVVGRSAANLRMFVTCGSGTVKFVDRTGEKKETGGDDFAWVVSALSISIESNSQPFIADLNGDFLEDVMFN